MRLRDLLPNFTPEQLANFHTVVAVDWEKKKAKIVIVDDKNVIVTDRELKTITAPTEPVINTQGEYWQRHHNPWLD